MHSQDPTYPLFPIFALTGFLLSLIPLAWHIHAWNSGTCAFMIWTALACLVGFVNSIVWKGNVNNSSEIWCDICTSLFAISNLGFSVRIRSRKDNYWCQRWHSGSHSVHQSPFILSYFGFYGFCYPGRCTLHLNLF